METSRFLRHSPASILLALALLWVPFVAVQSIDDGLRHYMQGTRALSHSAYQDELPGEWEKAFDIFMLHNFVDRRTVICGNYLGIYYKNEGQYKKALSYYERVLPIARRLEFGVNDVLMNMGHVFTYLGRYPQARDNYEKALSITRKAPDRAKEGVIILSLALLRSTLGDFDTALRLNGDALRLLGSESIENIATSHHNTGLIYYQRQEYAKALEYFGKAKRLFKQAGQSGDLQERQIGMTYLAMGKIGQAEAILKDKGTHIERGQLYLAKGDYASTRAQFDAAMKEWRESGDVENLFATYMGLGRAYEKTGEKRTSTAHYREARRILEGIIKPMTEAERTAFLKGSFSGFRRNEAMHAVAVAD